MPLAHLRLLQARQLLVATSASVTEIACCVGIAPTRLSAAFRAHDAVTPRMFRAAASLTRRRGRDLTGQRPGCARRRR